MVTTGALLHGDRSRFLDFNPEEQPLAVQLGGSNPQALAECAKMAEDWGYTEVNLNCGCPSDRVQEGKIGAILMAEPELVAECVNAMSNACSIPITVKHRIGIDEQDDYPAMESFVRTVSSANCDTFIVHARKAWLKGLSPKQNREVPPLKYEHVFALKKALPHLTIVINGGITSIEQSQNLLQHVDGVMIGREAYNNPYFLAQIDQQLYQSSIAAPSRDDVLHAFTDYCKTEIDKGNRLHHMSRHILGLYLGEYGARVFRRFVTERACKPDAQAEILLAAREAMNRSKPV